MNDGSYIGLEQRMATPILLVEIYWREGLCLRFARVGGAFVRCFGVRLLLLRRGGHRMLCRELRLGGIAARYRFA